MSEYTPKTWEIKHSYVDTTEYVQRMEKGESRSLAEINEEFDRWLESVKVEAAEAERKLMVRAIEDSSKIDISFSQPKDSYYKTRIVDKTTEKTKYESDAYPIGFAYNVYNNVIFSHKDFLEKNIRIELINTTTGDVVRSVEV